MEPNDWTDLPDRDAEPPDDQEETRRERDFWRKGDEEYDDR